MNPADLRGPEETGVLGTALACAIVPNVAVSAADPVGEALAAAVRAWQETGDPAQLGRARALIDGILAVTPRQ